MEEPGEVPPPLPVISCISSLANSESTAIVPTDEEQCTVQVSATEGTVEIASKDTATGQLPESSNTDNTDIIDSVAAETASVHSVEDDCNNLLEESSYVPEDDRDVLIDKSKRKLIVSDGFGKSFKKSKANDFYDDDEENDDDDFDEDDIDDDEDGAVAQALDALVVGGGIGGEEEDDDDFDEDDEDEFEIERQRHKASGFVNRYHKEYESDVDDSLGELSDDEGKFDNDKSMSSDPNESINLNDILNQGINLDKTVRLSDLVDNADELTEQLLSAKRRGVGEKTGRHNRMRQRLRVELEEEAGGDGDDDDDGLDEDDLKDEDDEMDMDFDISEKLKDMGEISLKPVSKNDPKKDYDLGDEISLEITKKGGTSGGGGGGSSSDTEDKRKITNLRKNIREVMDDNQLDASTLAAQREELERLARVQEQQRIIRDMQRQIANERQNSKMQNRVLSLLQGRTLLKNSTSGASSSASSSATSLLATGKSTFPSGSGTTLMKIPPGGTAASRAKGIFDGFSSNSAKQQLQRASLTPSVSIAPVRPPQLKKDVTSADIDTETEEEPIIDDLMSADLAASAEATSDVPKAKKEVVTIVDSSDDDCIVLSDDDEEPEDQNDDPQNSGLHVNDAYNVPDDQNRVVINIGHPESEQDIFVAPQIARVMKPHQIGGVRFLFDNIIESTERFSTSTGFGCILAHSMGLGKTLQLVCFCDIFLRHTNSKTILCIMPINTLQNWMAEFNMWLPDEQDKDKSRSAAGGGEVRARNFNLYVLNDTHKTLNARSRIVLEWAKNGGVLLMGYELYRLLSMKKIAKKRGRKVYRDPEVEKEEAEEHKKLLDEMHAALVKPGPDLIVCDEGHRIKNSHAGISVALKQIRSKRRVVLTGYPLQNNLLEYWCMVDFVRPNYLGTKTEFSNMFERPIQNGQCIDSTPQDIKLMRYRAHVLHSLLLGFVQRRSHVVLQNSLPQKEEYVLLVRMTPFQRKLYEVFMNEVVRTKAVPNPLKAFAVCCKIWNHPDVLYNFLKKREADLDLEEAEAAANDPTYEPPAAITATDSTALVKVGASKKGQPKEKKPRVNKPRPKKGAKPAASISPTAATPATASTPTITTSAPPPSLPTPVKTEDASIKVEKTEPVDINPPADQDIKPIIHTTLDTVKKESENNGYPQSGPPGNNYPQQQQYNQYNHQGYNQGYNNYDMNNYYGNYNNSYNASGGGPGGQHNFYQNYDQGYASGGYNSSNGQQYPQHGQHDYWNQNNQNYYPGNEYNQGYPNYGNDYNSGGSYPGYPQQSYPPHQGGWPNANPLTNEDVKPIISEDVKPSQIVDLDTKEIKIEHPLSMSLEIAKIEEKPIKTEDAVVSAAAAIVEPKTPKSTAAGTTGPTNTPVKEDVTTPEKDAKVKSEDGIPYDWALEIMKNYVPDLIENSPKMEIFFCILEESLKLGDRILVFSQSLLTLNLIEKFLQANKVKDTDVRWAKNLNYYRKYP